MAAGLGFKTFTTGEVLTAADVNGYLMQGILVFATEAARNSDITSPQEGQFAFTKDNNSLWYYTGSAWVASGATGDIEGVTAGVGISGGGTSGTVTITNDMATTITASGDIVVGTGSGTYDNLPIGSTGQVLTADTTVSPYKVKWAAPASGSTFVGASVNNNGSDYSISNNTNTVLDWSTEDYDTDAFHDTSSNTSRFTIPSGKNGKYLVTIWLGWQNASAGLREVAIRVNGSAVAQAGTPSSSANGTANVFSAVLNLVATDYVDARVWQNSGGTLGISGSTLNARFQISYLGA